jgi:hypothetical protein
VSYAGIARLVEEAKRAAGIVDRSAARSEPGTAPPVAIPRRAELVAERLRAQRARVGRQGRTPHDDCTCCRSWRVVELLSSADVVEIARLQADSEESVPPPLLPPRVRGVDIVQATT